MEVILAIVGIYVGLYILSVIFGVVMGLLGSIFNTVFGDSENSSDGEWGGSIPPFEISAVRKNVELSGEIHDCITFKAKGAIGNTYARASNIIVTLTDIDNEAVFGMIESLMIDKNLDPRFVFHMPIEAGHDDLVYLKDWITIGSIPISLLRFPRKGLRTFTSIGLVVDSSSGINDSTKWRDSGYHIATTKVSFTIDDFGYMDRFDNKDKIKELSIDMCMSMAAADGNLDQSELDIIKNWIKRDFESIEDSSERSKDKEKFTNYIKTSYDNAKKGSLSFDKITYEINAKFDDPNKYNLIELLLEVAAADNEFSSEEDMLLSKIVRAINIDQSTFDTMKNKIVLTVGSIDSERTSLESLFGITDAMSKSEKCTSLRKQYSKWLGQTTNSDSKIKKRAEEMIENISKLRDKYNCE